MNATPNDVVARDQFITKIGLMAADEAGGIPISDAEVQTFLQAPEKKTTTRNVRLVTD